MPGLASLSTFLAACSVEPQDSLIQSRPFADSIRAEGPLFSDVGSDESGLHLVNAYDDPKMWGTLYQEFQGGAIGTGIAAGDVDSDGWIDLYIVNKAGPNKLYRQVAPLRFEDVSEAANVSGGDGWGSGASFADVDNDGDLDLYVSQIHDPDKLYFNDGSGRFTEAPIEAGVPVAPGSVISAFEDYDRDGDLDLFILTNVASAVRSPEGEPDFLFQNDGNGAFTDVTASAGIALLAEKGHSAVWWDANDDGWPDLYIANDFEAPDHLYLNNGDGTFSDKSEEILPHTAWFSMGSDFGDVNNDGRFDFLVADMASTTHFKQKATMGDMGGLIDYMDTLKTPQYMVNALYLNNGSRYFMEAARLMGVASTDWTWSTRFEDLDNDGYLDLHVTNGMVRSFNDSDMVNRIKRMASREQVVALVRNSPPLSERNLAYRNTGEWGFERLEGTWGLAHEGVSFGSIVADLDNDGDVDILYANYEDKVSLYRNNGQSHSVTFELRGRRSNRFGVGARLTLESESGLQTRQVSIARGALSSAVVPTHFGLGESTTISRVTIDWPSGVKQVFRDLEANRRYVIEEAEGSEMGNEKSERDPASPLFAAFENGRGLEFENREQVFNDMIRQPLLPNRMNTLGGGIAWGDADGDGDSDVYFAGAKGQTGELYLNDGSGSFSLDSRNQPWKSKTDIEEMAPLWIDANGDGLLDLYVSSGGVEGEPGDEEFKDSLYLNQGDGLFRESPMKLIPEMEASGGAVASVDFDKDGDLDLFVGGRVVPGQYPTSPQSHLLENRNGTFIERQSPVSGLGMVTSALWTDANGDHWPDLLVAGEWEPLRLFLNEKGVLKEVDSVESGLDPYKGWWNSLVAADIDADGDMDYIAGNVGLNTKYHASGDKPVQLYYGDFEGKGKPNIVEAEFEGDALFPIRGKSCSTNAMPSLGTKFPTFKSFASALLTDIYDVNKADVYEATELAHGVFVNDGRAGFEFRPLHGWAQISSAYGLAAGDFNGDSHVDIVMGHNFHGPQVETSRFDGGLSLLLFGDGTGTFDPQDPSESGVAIQGEVRGLSISDVNQDGWPDLALTQVNGPVTLLVNQGSDRGKRSVAIELAGPPEVVVGASVYARYSDGRRQRWEVHSGGGYLSQSEPLVFVGFPPQESPESIDVHWADGKWTPIELSGEATLRARHSESIERVP